MFGPQSGFQNLNEYNAPGRILIAVDVPSPIVGYIFREVVIIIPISVTDMPLN